MPAGVASGSYGPLGGGAAVGAEVAVGPAVGAVGPFVGPAAGAVGPFVGPAVGVALLVEGLAVGVTGAFVGLSPFFFSSQTASTPAASAHSTRSRAATCVAAEQRDA